MAEWNREQPVDPALDQLMTRSKAWIQRRTLALYGVSDENAGLEGTGTLWQIADRHFIVTAAHVVDPFLRGERLLHLADPGQRAPGIEVRQLRAHHSTMPASGDRKHDLHDIAIVCLPADIAGRIVGPHLRPVRLYDVALDYSAQRGDFFGVHGFPDELCQVVAIERTREVHTRDFFIGSDAILDLPRDLAEDIGTAKVVVSRYRLNRVWHRGRRSKAPDPHGMSGAALWLIFRTAWAARPWSEDRIQLAAVMHTWRKEHGVTIATPASEVIRFLYQFEPSLRKSIEVALSSARRAG